MTLPNPFASAALKGGRTLPAANVADLHKPALSAVHQAVADARAAAAPVGLLVRGEAGSGKTHLLAQLRHDLRADPAAGVVEVDLQGAAPGRLWRHVRAAVAHDLLDANGALLARILQARYPKWAAKGASGGLFIDALLGTKGGPALPGLLAAEVGLPTGLRAVLPRLYDPATAGSAADWLRGQPLDTRTLGGLGLPVPAPDDEEQGKEQDLEADAREVVLALLRLATPAVALVVCFDNVEAIQAGQTDAHALGVFAWVAGELATGADPRVVVTFARPETVLRLRKAADMAALERLSHAAAAIPPLEDWEPVRRLVAARLDALPEWRAARQAHPDPLWPVGEPFLRGLLATNPYGLTVRHLVNACRVRVQEALKGDGAAKPKPIGQAFDAHWQKRRDKCLAQPAGSVFDTVLSLGLPWLREAVAAPLDPFHEAPDGLNDVNLLFRPAAGGLVGVTFCNHEPTPLRWRLQRLRKKQWPDARRSGLLAALVLVRRAGTRDTEHAKGELAQLVADGVTVLRLPDQQYAELAAYQSMQAHVNAGDYTDGGRVVTAAEFAGWAAGHLSSGVKDLADQVFGPLDPLVPLTPAAARPGRKTAAAAS